MSDLVEKAAVNLAAVREKKTPDSQHHQFCGHELYSQCPFSHGRIAGNGPRPQ